MKTILSTFDRQFLTLDRRSRELLGKLDEKDLFARPRKTTNPLVMFSCGEYLLRSAAVVEKTFGGITTRLWDDPFEWTLPEKLSDKGSILQYFDEVEKTRLHGIDFIASDDVLLREIPSPERLRPLIDILIETISHASHFQGRAFAVFQMISDEKLPRI